MNLFQIIFIPVCLVAAIAALMLGEKRGVSKQGRTLWTLLWILGAATIAAPQHSTKIAAFLGIGRGTDLILYMAVIVALIVIRYFYLRMNHLEALITQLARQLALNNPVQGTVKDEIQGQDKT